ncbi:hypothetical protein SFRURICE_004600 [Spodoptera frugiperda]|nr:hypothetical protein SFRURICE_004600 [Spodoptera frugiperda]
MCCNCVTCVVCRDRRHTSIERDRERSGEIEIGQPIKGYWLPDLDQDYVPIKNGNMIRPVNMSRADEESPSRLKQWGKQKLIFMAPGFSAIPPVRNPNMPQVIYSLLSDDRQAADDVTTTTFCSENVLSCSRCFVG